MTVDLETVVIQPLKLLMVQPQDMTLFQIIDSSIIAINMNKPQEGIRMTIVMKRKMTSEMMSTYFPSLLLMLITFATTFFKPFFFEAALSVNLTTMLVMTTIFISKMEGLPSTSDPKMIDFWLILCQLVPFAEVVLLTSMEYIREVDDIKESKKKRKKRRKHKKSLKMQGTMDERFNEVNDQDNESVDVNGSVGSTISHQTEPQQLGRAWTIPQKAQWRKPSLMTVLKTLGKYFNLILNILFPYFREEGVARTCGYHFVYLLWCCCHVPL